MTSQALAKNTDGFDSLNLDGLTVTNTRVDVGDDCFSPKPNTTHIFVQNLWCNNTHGVSMGSIGQYPGVMDVIEHAYIQNVTLLNGEVSLFPSPSHHSYRYSSSNVLEWSPSQSMGRQRRRLRPHHQHHIQGHPRREHRPPDRARPVLL